MENSIAEQGLPVPDDMPGPRILLLRQATNTAIALETSPLRQGLHHLPPAPEVMPDLRMLQ